MFDSISVSNFRGFRDFTIDSLSRVSLLTGRNNVGKTALLEAIFLLVGGANVNLVGVVSSHRGIVNFNLSNPVSVRDSMWNPLFWRFDTDLTITISGRRGGDGQQHTVELDLAPTVTAQLDVVRDSSELGQGADGLGIEALQFSGSALRQRYIDPQGNVQEARMVIDAQGVRVEPLANPWVPGVFTPARNFPNPGEDAERFGQLELAEGTDNLLEALRIVEPRLKRLTTVYSAGLATIYGDVGMGRMIPLPVMGDGIGRLATVFLAIANTRGGVVLVDEVETGLHHTVLSAAWRALSDAARRYDVQVFSTTHSFEFVQAAYRAFEDSEDSPFRLHRLEQTEEGIRAVGYDEEALAAAMEAEFEVR